LNIVEGGAPLEAIVAMYVVANERLDSMLLLLCLAV